MGYVGVAVIFPWQIKVLFSYGTWCFVHVLLSLNGLNNHSPSASVLPVEGHLLTLEAKKTGFKATQFLRALSFSSGSE